MEIASVEKQRSALLQLLLLVVMAALGIVTYISVREGLGLLVPALTLISLMACLYVIARERSLKNLHAELINQVISKERQVKSLNKELKGEQTHVKEEKEKADNLQARLKEITALYRAISTVNSVQDPARTLDTVLRAAIDLVECDRGSVMVLDDKKERMVIVASQGLSGEAVANTNQRVGEGIAGWVAQHCEPVLVTEELKNDERFRDLLNREIRVGGAMSVPLHARGTVIGVMNFAISKDNPKTQFTDHDLRIASIFTQHASAAIENVHLIKSLQRLKQSLQPT
jgi:transcriptional regulator with GAF, ATPase, and Fis domain